MPQVADKRKMNIILTTEIRKPTIKNGITCKPLFSIFEYCITCDCVMAFDGNAHCFKCGCDSPTAELNDYDAPENAEDYEHVLEVLY